MPVINASDLPTGNLEGTDYGTTISLILDHSEPGHGPRLHKHPYDEAWVVVEGYLTFQAGEERLGAKPGDVVIVPTETPHKFTNNGPGRANLVCIHAHPSFVTEWLEGGPPLPQQSGGDQGASSSMYRKQLERDGLASEFQPMPSSGSKRNACDKEQLSTV